MGFSLPPSPLTPPFFSRRTKTSPVHLGLYLRKQTDGASIRCYVHLLYHIAVVSVARCPHGMRDSNAIFIYFMPHPRLESALRVRLLPRPRSHFPLSTTVICRGTAPQIPQRPRRGVEELRGCRSGWWFRGSVRRGSCKRTPLSCAPEQVHK